MAIFKKSETNKYITYTLFGFIKITIKKDLDITSEIKKCPDKLKEVVIDYVEVCITTRCTLRCINCANLNTNYYIPDYNVSPYDFDMNIIIDNVNLFLSNVYEVKMFRIMGGEPFMHKELYRLVELAKANPKIINLEIVTNGTLIPKDKNLFVLRHSDKIRISISNYGKVSSKVEELKKLLNNENIKIYENDCLDDNSWYDMGDVYCRNRTVDEIIDVYNSCYIKNCKHILNGKLYGCSRMAHAHNLGLYVPEKNEFIDISQYRDNIKDEIYNLYATKLKYYNLCNYCDGTGKYSKIVDAAIQLE